MYSVGPLANPPGYEMGNARAGQHFSITAKLAAREAISFAATGIGPVPALAAKFAVSCVRESTLNLDVMPTISSDAQRFRNERLRRTDARVFCWIYGLMRWPRRFA